MPEKNEEMDKQAEPVVSENLNMPLFSNTGLPLWCRPYECFNPCSLPYIPGLNFPFLYNPIPNFAEYPKERCLQSNFGLPIPFLNNAPILYDTPQRIEADFFSINVDKDYYNKVYGK